MGLYTRKGVYYADIRLPDGSRVVRSTGKHDKRSARLEESNIRDDLVKGRRDGITLGAAIEVTLASRWVHTRNSKGAYANAKASLSHFGDVPLSSLRGESVASLRASLVARGLSCATVNRHLAALRTVIGECYKQELTPLPPCAFQLLKEPKGRLVWLTQEEEARLLRACGETDLSALVEILLDTGGRIEEVISLTPRCVDLTTGMVSFWQTKSGVPRSVPMTRRVRATLEGAINDGEEYFPYGYHYYRKAFVAAVKLADLPRAVTFHTLRHTCASRLVQRGIPLYTVSKWLGHASITVTQRYAHLAPDSLDVARKALEQPSL